jgi:hypothetical protein
LKIPFKAGGVSTMAPTLAGGNAEAPPAAAVSPINAGGGVRHARRANFQLTDTKGQFQPGVGGATFG